VIPGRKTRTILSDDRDLSKGASGGAFRLPSWCLRELAKLFVGVPGGDRAEVTKTEQAQCHIADIAAERLAASHQKVLNP
jgi:hypothetical protein